MKIVKFWPYSFGNLAGIEFRLKKILLEHGFNSLFKECVSSDVVILNSGIALSLF